MRAVVVSDLFLPNGGCESVEEASGRAAISVAAPRLVRGPTRVAALLLFEPVDPVRLHQDKGPC